MIVKLSFLEVFESDFNNQHYKIFSFVNPVTFEVINGVNLEINIKLIPYELYKCTLERRGKKWRITNVGN